MAATDFNTILGGTAPPNAAALMEALEKRSIYVVESSENPAALTPGFVLYLAFNGIIFWYDSTDATTAHDGVTCIVTADGKRYKSDQYAGVSSKWIPVLDKDLTAPPGSPVVGDTYIVGAGATGAWATKDKNFATWAARGWSFYPPKAFDYAYVRDESLIYHYSAGGAWTAGIPALTIADASISHKKLKWFPMGISVINQTTNAPPGSPADGDAYIVGGAPSGAWVGHSLKLAIWESSSSAWAIFAGYEGARVYDKALNKLYTHDGSVWTAPIVSNRIFIEKRVISSPVGNVDFFNLGGYTEIYVSLNDMRPSNDNVELLARLSSDNSTFITTSTYPGGGSSSWNVTGVQAGSDAVGNAAGDGGLSGSIHLRNFNLAQKTQIFGDVVWWDANITSAQKSNQVRTSQSAQTAMQGFRLFFEAGNVAQATIIVEGLA